MSAVRVPLFLVEQKIHVRCLPQSVRVRVIARKVNILYCARTRTRSRPLPVGVMRDGIHKIGIWMKSKSLKCSDPKRTFRGPVNRATYIHTCSTVRSKECLVAREVHWIQSGLDEWKVHYPRSPSLRAKITASCTAVNMAAKRPLHPSHPQMRSASAPTP